jgi:hypothetical protein
MLQTLSKQTLHHTNICVGRRDEIIQDVDACISRVAQESSRVERLVYEYDKFLVDDAEHIFSTHLHKTGADEMQIICISFNTTNIETQNKILKMLEEPRPHTYFFLIIPTLQIILPTIISRAQVFTYATQTEISEQTKKFVQGNISDRLEHIKKIVDTLKDETINKQDVLYFIEEIEKYVHQTKNMNMLKKIIHIKNYMRDSGASTKQLLEYIAVIL